MNSSTVAGEYQKTIDRQTKKKWTNRERVLVFCSRGTGFRDRHLMQDFRTLLPHAKSESKMNKKERMANINEMCEMKNCSKCVYFESRKRQDLYIWISNVPAGPSVKFLAKNVHTMSELRLSGNCLKSSRPILCFDEEFKDVAHLRLIKELFTQVFGTPRYHPRSQPFVDHVFNFSVTMDGNIWFRNYQVVDESGELEEIGPRMVVEPIKIFEGSFSGEVLYENPRYKSPNLMRSQLKKSTATKYTQRIESKKSLTMRQMQDKKTFDTDPLDDVFETSVPDPMSDEDENIGEDRLLKSKDGKEGIKSKKFRKRRSKKKMKS